MSSHTTRATEENVPTRYIGPGDDCHFSTLRAAISFAEQASFSDLILRLSGDREHYRGDTYKINMRNFSTLRTLTIRGGYDSCSSNAGPSGHTVLNADNNDRVFEIRYDANDRHPVRTIILENLRIEGGDAGDSRGGGVLVTGNSQRQTVHFRNVSIRDNVAQYGGGMSVRATAASARDLSHPWVTIDNQSAIVNNQASRDGGGLHCNNTLDEQNSFIRVGTGLISGNRARSGGGVYVYKCNSVELMCGAPIVSIFPTGGINFNTAQGVGGGIAVFRGVVFVYGNKEIDGFGDKDHAALILGNEADTGGGVYLQESVLGLIDTVVSGNIARDAGGGLSVIFGSTVLMGRAGSTCRPKSSRDGPVVRVHRCSRLTGNHANGHGGALLVRGLGGQCNVRLYQTFITNNTASGLGSVAMVTDDAELLMDGAVIYGNHGSSRLFQLENGSLTGIDWSTIAGNRDPEDPPLQMFRLLHNQDHIDTNTRLRVRGSILWEPGATMINRTERTFTPSNCVIGHYFLEKSGFSVGSNFYSSINPQLRDPAEGDLRLSSDSPAIDYCNTADVGTDARIRDMFDNPRGIEFDGSAVEAPNQGNGFYDIGAHEVQ